MLVLGGRSPYPTMQPPRCEKKEGGGRKEESLPLDLDSQHLALDSVVLRAEEAAA